MVFQTRAGRRSRRFRSRVRRTSRTLRCRWRSSGRGRSSRAHSIHIWSSAR
jgi:hypothetical protein